MEKLNPKTDGTTLDVVNQNVEALRELFPEAFTEDKIDFDVLREALGNYLEERPERYSFNWNGKSQARRIAQTPSTGTLRPCPEESVNWETTQNLFIEGDNLEVLKLLQKSYHKKIKMIYIDPPYNTGNDFIYPDNFRDNISNYLELTGQTDEGGRKFSTNREESGRYHTNWLNMMYPRLKLARNLLRDDGVIFISIDDHEITNLVKLCDEVFGEENRLGIITVVSNLKGRSDDKYFATAHNYLLAYSRGDFVTRGVSLPESYLDDYPEQDDSERRYRLLGLRKRGSGAKREDRPNMFFPIYGSPSTASVSLEMTDEYNIKILPRLSDGTDGRWRWGRDTVGERISELVSRLVGSTARLDVFQIDYADAENGLKRIKPKTTWTGSEFSNEAGTLEVKKLLGTKLFDNPKPVGLVSYCLEQAIENADIVLDVFAGSCTTAHAVLDLNRTDGGNRKFIMVQLPEPCDEKSEAFKAGYATIADIGKERIRRVIKQIEAEQAEKAKEAEGTLLNNEDEPRVLDLGFKVLKLDSSNIRSWDADFDSLETTLLDSVDNIKNDRSESDVLYEILIKYGLDLTIPIEQRKIDGKVVYILGAGALIICLDDSISLEVVEGIAELKTELKPEVIRVVFKDAGFKDDVVKTNAVQILRQAGINDVKSL